MTNMAKTLQHITTGVILKSSQVHLIYFVKNVDGFPYKTKICCTHFEVLKVHFSHMVIVSQYFC